MQAAFRFAILCLTWSTVAAGQAADQAGSPARYRLAYQFRPGETVRWNVVHQATVQTTIQGVRQTAQTRSESVKAWRVREVTPAGDVELVHMVEYVRMSNQVSHRAKVTYDSREDNNPPPGFEQAAQSVGVPLTVVRLSRQGKVLRRDEKLAQPLSRHDTPITIPLPEEPVAVGDTWSEPHELRIPNKKGGVHAIKTRRRFELRRVKNGVATIAVKYQILTPVHDPAIEAQLVQRLGDGTIKFDVDAGRILSQQMDVDKRVHDFAGPGALMHYVMRFSEELLRDEEKVAKRPAS